MDRVPFVALGCSAHRGIDHHMDTTPGYNADRYAVERPHRSLDGGSKEQGNGSTMPFPIETNESLRPGKAAHAGLRTSKRRTRLTRFIRHAFGQIRADDYLVDKPIQAGSQTISHAQLRYGFDG